MGLPVGFPPLLSESITHFLPRAESDKPGRPGMRLKMKQIASLTKPPSPPPSQSWIPLRSHMPRASGKSKAQECLVFLLSLFPRKKASWCVCALNCPVVFRLPVPAVSFRGWKLHGFDHLMSVPLEWPVASSREGTLRGRTRPRFRSLVIADSDLWSRYFPKSLVWPDC